MLDNDMLIYGEAGFTRASNEKERCQICPSELECRRRQRRLSVRRCRRRTRFASGMTSLCAGQGRAGLFTPAYIRRSRRHVAPSAMGACFHLGSDLPPSILVSPHKTRSHRATSTQCRNPRPIAVSNRWPLAMDYPSKSGGKSISTFLQRSLLASTRSIGPFSALK
jgi:hypothetical protein